MYICAVDIWERENLIDLQSRISMIVALIPDTNNNLQTNFDSSPRGLLKRRCGSKVPKPTVFFTVFNCVPMRDDIHHLYQRFAGPLNEGESH